ncbi:MAG: SUMF1/EgtB/PvdO family nonheme iron enzyme [Chloroflexi bacterium]|nr:SUMF1/EgtB/PvdO family nonheme iron enzyme [Chloroflexota bacterium]
MSSHTPNEIQVSVGETRCEFVLVPAGTFVMGTDPSEVSAVTARYPDVQAAWILKETPNSEVYLPDFYIARTPITTQLWTEYAYQTGSTLQAIWAESTAEPNHPVAGVSYEEVEAFCNWLSAVSAYEVSLPTEAQWEKAARGTDGREYPWGYEFDAARCNTREGGCGGVTPVDRFPAGASPYGVLDMAGNVEEWTSDLYQPYPGGNAVTDDLGGPGKYRVTRGGHWEGGGDLARCARRHGAWEHSRTGARLVLAAL